MENLLKPEITAALGWTLLHSLWQGVGLAVLYFGMSKFIKSAEAKYSLGIGAMLTQFGLAIGTFAYVGDFTERSQTILKRVMYYVTNYPRMIQVFLMMFNSF